MAIFASSYLPCATKYIGGSYLTIKNVPNKQKRAKLRGIAIKYLHAYDYNNISDFSSTAGSTKDDNKTTGLLRAFPTANMVNRMSTY